MRALQERKDKIIRSIAFHNNQSPILVRPLPPGFRTIPLGLPIAGPAAGAILFRVGFAGVVIDVTAHRVITHLLLVEVVHVFRCGWPYDRIQWKPLSSSNDSSHEKE